MDQGTLVLAKNLLLNAHEYPDIIYEYMKYVIGSAKAVRNSLKSGASDAQIEMEAKYMLRFEHELAEVLIMSLICLVILKIINSKTEMFTVFLRS